MARVAPISPARCCIVLRPIPCSCRAEVIPFPSSRTVNRIPASVRDREMVTRPGAPCFSAQEHEELAKLRPALDGNAVMKLLGVGPSRVVGEALDFLLEIRVEDGEISEAEATDRLLAWAKERE